MAYLFVYTIVVSSFITYYASQGGGGVWLAGYILLAIFGLFTIYDEVRYKRKSGAIAANRLKRDISRRNALEYDDRTIEVRQENQRVLSAKNTKGY